MSSNSVHITISPQVIKNNFIKVNYTGDSYIDESQYVVCCDIYTSAVTKFYTGQTYAYSSMKSVITGGLNGTSLLTGMTIPIVLTENTIDIGYYSVFDGMVLQKDTMINFLFSASTGSPYTYYFYNTSDTEFKKYLNFSKYSVDWGDGSLPEDITTSSPDYYSHPYSQSGEFTITMSGMSPWGINLIKKQVVVPFTGTTIPNPNGTAYFVPTGGNWSGTPLMYDYIFSGDSNCDIQDQVFNSFTTIPFTITGYTRSSINDLQVYGNKYTLFGGKFKIGVPVTGTSGSVGVFWGPSVDGLYTAYTINDIDYYDYSDGTTIFAVKSSGLTEDMLVCSALTKNEVLLNIIDEPEVWSDIFIERGKQSGLERMIRLGEVDNVGDLEKYGYGFFNVIKI
jgi:hypothetical protein